MFGSDEINEKKKTCYITHIYIVGGTDSYWGDSGTLRKD